MKKLLLLLALAFTAACTSTSTATASAPAKPAAQSGPVVTATYQHPQVRIVTTEGTLVAELFEDKCPNTVANFVGLAQSGFYKDLRFHRIIPGFMAQGGCPNTRRGQEQGHAGTGGPGYAFDNECTPQLLHVGRGILSMANSGPDTNGSQFFLCFNDTPWLNGKHTVFGRVIEGLDVLDRLEAAGSRSGNPSKGIWMDIQVKSLNNHPYSVVKNNKR